MTVKIDIPFPELRKAIVALNESELIVGLDKDKLAAIGVSSKIKLVAISREDMLKHFMGTFDLIEDGPDGKCPAPKEALDFYNKVIELEEKAKAVGPEEGSPGVETTVTVEKKEKGGKNLSNGEISKNKGPGVIASILAIIIAKGPISKDGILSELEVIFPDRHTDKMKKTIQAQLSGKNGSRMEKEQNVIFEHDDKGISIKK